MINNVVNSIVAGAIGLLVLAGVLVGVNAFQGTQSAVVTATCNVSGSGVTTGCGAAYNLTVATGALSQNFGAQLPTVGTMFGVALILGAIGLIGYGIAQGARKF